MTDERALRERAEAMVGDGLEELHELRVHQVELEMQNEELRRIQAELARSRARYFDLYDLAPVGFCSLSERGHVLEANLTMSQLLGVPRGQVIARPFTQFVARDDQDRFYLQRKRLTETGLSQSGELRLVSGRGADFWAQLVMTAATDDDGTHVHRVAVSDVSERVRAEAAFGETQERLSAVLATAHEVIITTDADGLITEWNRQADALFGWSRHEAVGKDLAVLIMPERCRTEQQQAMRHAAHNDHWSSQTRREFRVHRRSGEEVLVEYTVSTAQVHGMTYYSAFMTDLTARRAAEDAKAKLETQLQQAQRLESVGRLAGGVAHDFNNMIGVIVGLTESVMAEVGPRHASHADLQQITQTSARSTALVRQLMAFARQQTIAPRVLDLNTQVSNVLAMLARVLGEDVALRFEPTPELWATMMDSSQFDQLLTNLCVNARDAIMSVGTITVTTSNEVVGAAFCAQRAEAIPGEYVRLTVSDTGTGMDAATLSHMFEPFFTAKPVGKGTGLGLATVYGAVMQNHGFIDVSSELGRGTDITIYLPRCRTEGESHAAASTVEPVASHVRDGEPSVILLVEDEPALLHVTTRQLERLGYQVLPVNHPSEAIHLAKRADVRIDLLLTDVVMPTMNGRDLAATIMTYRPRMSQLFMSGFTLDIIASEHHGDTSVNFLQKPFSGAELALAVRAALAATQR